MTDLGPRAVSALVMIAVAGTALWLGGWPFAIFVTVVAVGVLFEWWNLAARIARTPTVRAAWIALGLAYLFLAAVSLIALRKGGFAVALQLLLMVIAVDIGAYFAGRAIGGPRIAPRISPSKTWAGLGGGIVGAAIAHAALMRWTFEDFDRSGWSAIAGMSLIAGALVAVVAQAGDFFESWMKRRASVKDSGSLIPGHGGLFDRVDGLMAVLVVIALFSWAAA